MKLAMLYQKENIPLLIIAVKSTAPEVKRLGGKGDFLLGIKAVIAESFERIPSQ